MARDDSEARDPRIKQVLVGVFVFVALSACIVITMIGWRYLPEVLADWLGTIVGIMTTPFFLEASFILIGLTIVVAVNAWRQRRVGDDYVELEVKDAED